MSDLLFNIRIGTTHYQLTNKYKFRKSYNPHHEGYPEGRFSVYCIFGVHLN